MHKTIFAALVFLFSCNSHAQDNPDKKIDSLLGLLRNAKATSDSAKVKTLNLLAENYFFTDQDKSLEAAKKAKRLSQKIKWEKGTALSNLNIARYNISRANYKEAEGNLNAAEKIFTKHRDLLFLTDVYLQKGALEAYRSETMNSLTYLFQAYRYSSAYKPETQERKTRQTILRGRIHMGIANVYNEIGQHAKAIKYYDLAITSFRKLSDHKTLIAICLANKGVILKKEKQYLAALSVVKEAEQILKPVTSEKHLINTHLNSLLGNLYLDLDNQDLSIHYSEKALQAIESSETLDLKSSIIHSLGFAYLEKGQKLNDENLEQLGIRKIKESIVLDEKQKNFERLTANYLQLSEHYQWKNNHKESLANYVLYAAYKDSLHNSANKESLQNLEDKRTIELKQNEIMLNKVKLKANEDAQHYFVAGILLLVIIAGLLFYQNKIRKKNNYKLQLMNSELEQANKIKLYFFSILNHDMRGPLANLIHLLHLKKENSEVLDEHNKHRLETTVVAGAEHLLESMEDLLMWSKGQMDNFAPHPKKVNCDKLFYDIKNHFSGYENVTIKFDNEPEFSLFTDEDYLKTIVRNLTANAISALYDTLYPKIIWKAWSDENKTYLQIADNGKGAESESFRALFDDRAVIGIKTGLGLHLIRDLAKIINCHVTVNRETAAGTSITLSFRNQS